MSREEPDGYELSRALTEQLRHELRDIRRDVEAIVDAEVRRAADGDHIETLVRRAVRREMAARRSWPDAHGGWLVPAAGVALGVALGLSVFATLSVRNVARDQTTPTPAVVASASPPSPATLEVEPHAMDPARLAARYDSLFQAKGASFEPLLRSVEAATQNAVVLGAIEAWRVGGITEAQRDRLHAAFVQLVLRDAIDPSLEVDGGILRDPCRGVSCSALLELWRAEGHRFSLPPYEASIAADGAAVRQAERVLVLNRLESGQ